jgi:hypothetical protein
MKARCNRLFRRPPVPSSTARARIREKAERLRDLYDLEIALALSRPTLDLNYLLD